jgi:hypothetical protein
MCMHYGRHTHNAHLDIVYICMGWKCLDYNFSGLLVNGSYEIQDIIRERSYGSNQTVMLERH